MPAAMDITGRRYERLVAVNLVSLKPRRWLCVCDCGGSTTASAGTLNFGHSRSCGCLQREAASRAGKKARRHGMKGSKEYSAWNSMKDRCSNKNNESFLHYGGRGITVCDRWLYSFEHFFEDMGSVPNGWSLDRIDVNGNYEPGNCRWASWRVQAGNRRNNRTLTLNGETKNVIDWARQLGVSWQTLQGRADLGWSEDEILTIKPGRRSRRNLAGCYFHKSSQKWVALALINGKRTQLGSFGNREDASARYMEVVGKLREEGIIAA